MNDTERLAKWGNEWLRTFNPPILSDPALVTAILSQQRRHACDADWTMPLADLTRLGWVVILANREHIVHEPRLILQLECLVRAGRLAGSPQAGYRVVV